MGEREHQAIPDDIDIEVSRLRGASHEAHPREMPPRSPLVRSLTSGQRARRAVVAAGVALLALLIVIGGTPSLRDGVRGRLARLIPPPTATLAPGADLITITADMPWATVTLDGHALAAPPSGDEAPLRVEHGRHRLDWRAAPFPPQTCTFSVPPAVGDTCVTRPALTADGTSVRSGARQLVLGADFSTLAGVQQQALAQAIGAALTGFTTTVQPGEPTLVQTTQGTALPRPQLPLRATLVFTPDLNGTYVPPQSCTTDAGGTLTCPSLNPQTCQQLCTLPSEVRASHLSVAGAPEWLVLAPVALAWTYATLAGTVVARGQPIDEGGAAVADTLALLRVTWDGTRWHVQALFGPNLGPPIAEAGQPVADDPACAAAEDTFADTLSLLAGGWFASGANPAEGCVLVGIATPGTALFLMRFGWPLAANALAHRLEPSYPVADAYEQQLAQQLAAGWEGSPAPRP